jgi:hypothetical protein
MDLDEQKLLEILNTLLKDDKKNISSITELSDFNCIYEIIKIM